MAVPTITSISPNGGSADGGTTVTIVGTNLGTPTAVHFGATDATSFAGESATRMYAVAPAGSGVVDVTVTTAGGTSAAGTAYTYGAVLFTVAEARAFDKAQLASATDYPNATITDKEAEIREWLQRVCRVEFVTTTHTDEYHSGDGTRTLELTWPRIQSVTAVSLRSEDTWTALTADELADLLPETEEGATLYREGSFWPWGVRNIKITYVAGWTAVPELVNRAALRICVAELPSTNIPFSADRYDAGGMDVSFAMGDGFRGNWHRDAEVRKVINLYGHGSYGIA